MNYHIKKMKLSLKFIQGDYMGRLIPIDGIREELDSYPFLDAPKGYWNLSKDGYNGFEQVMIEDMSEKHKKTV